MKLQRKAAIGKTYPHLISITREFFTYFGASALAFLADMLSFSFLIRVLHFGWAWAATTSFAIGLVVVYAISVRFVFHQRRLASSKNVEFLFFSLIGLTGLAITQLCLWIGINFFGMMPEFVKFLAAGATLVFNFGARKLLLFRDIPLSR